MEELEVSLPAPLSLEITLEFNFLAPTYRRQEVAVPSSQDLPISGEEG